MTHPYTAASRRSAGSASAGYQSPRASAQPVPKASILDNIVEKSAGQTALEQILDAASKRPGQQALEDAIAQGNQRRAGLSTAERLAKIRLPKRLPGLPHTGNQVWGDMFAMILMYQGHRLSDGAAPNAYPLISNFSFYRGCATPSFYNQGCAILPSPGACVFGGGGGTWMACTSTNIAGPGSSLASVTFISVAKWSGAIPDRTGDIAVYRRMPLGNTAGGRVRGWVEPHAARPSDMKAVYGPLVPALAPKKGPFRNRPERKWFPELELPRMWTPQPLAAPMSWLKHRPMFNPMRAPSEQSQRGPIKRVRLLELPKPAPKPQLKVATKPKTWPILVEVGPPGPRTREPPPKGTKEQKLQVRGMKVILTAVNALTEGFDYLDAFYDALPKHCKRTKAQRGLRQMRPQHKAMAVMQCWGELSWKDVIKNLIENEVEDRVFGGLGQGLKPLNRAMGRPVGVQTGIGSPGKTPKGTQMGKKPWDNWTDYIWP